MKKRAGVLAWVLIGCMLLAGCGGSAAGSRYTLPFRGAEIAVDDDMAPLAEKLGEPTAYAEAASCVFDGMDREYTYGGVVIRTRPAEGKDYVFTVELRDDTVPTGEGVYIGDSREDVLAAYGGPAGETGGALRYEDGNCTLTFTLTDGRVTGILYASDAG